MAELASAAPTSGGVSYVPGPIVTIAPLTLTSARDPVVFLDALLLLPKMAQSPSLDRRMSVSPV